MSLLLAARRLAHTAQSSYIKVGVYVTLKINGDIADSQNIEKNYLF